MPRLANTFAAPGFPTRTAPPVCRREKIAAAILGMLVVELPWVLGGINVTAQFINLGIALLAFAALFIPLNDPLSPTPRQNVRQLLKFPVFWLGLAFLGYVLIQYFNPHLAFCRGVRNGEGVWWMQPVPYVDWLPSGTETPYYPMNALRFFVMWATPLLAMCVAKLAIRRRRTWYALLWVCVLNACVICAVGIAVRASDSNFLLGIVGPFPRPWEVVPQTFFASFVYSNHAGMFLYLNLAVALGLFLCLRQKALAEGERSGRYWLACIPVLVLTTGGFVTGSRAGIAIIFALLACAMLTVVWQAARSGGGAFLKVLLIFAGLGAAATAGFVLLDHGRTPLTIERLQNLNVKSSVENRMEIMRLSTAVARDRLLWGWGAGSFAYVSQPYLKKATGFADPKHPGRLVRYLAHCHCDWIELPCDLGLLGCLPLVGIGLYWLAAILRRWRTLPETAWMLLAGVLALAAHAAFDFPLSCPAIQLMLVLMLCAAAFLAKAAAPARP